MPEPYFYSLAEFVAMGEHGVYVWSCWGITLAVVVGFVVYSHQQRRALLKRIGRQQLRRTASTKSPSQSKTNP